MHLNNYVKYQYPILINYSFNYLNIIKIIWCVNLHEKNKYFLFYTFFVSFKTLNEIVINNKPFI